MTEETKKISIVEKEFKEKIISWIVMLLIFITIFWNMLNIFLLTFIITFIFYHLIALVQRKICKRFSFEVPDGLILSILYIVFIALLVIGGIEIAPKIVKQFIDIGEILIAFDINAVRASIDPRLAELFGHIDFNRYISEAGTMLATGVTTISIFGVSLFLSLILSFLLLLEKKKIKRFGERLSGSKISFVYHYWIEFGGNFSVTFGKVMKVQVTIAFINMIASMILLAFLGFPKILGLGVMIFLLGLIPVAGVTISLIPLSIIAFNIGGITKVIAVILMIALIHAMESYLLNPKLMSSKTELPVCFVFIILIVAENYLGVWGLLIGVPIFIFLMRALDVDYSSNPAERT
ncbi:MAG: AI-2E family transporter [Eubacteriales bacterium]|nr:AI-2E family transporter [Eubacteriales bacterium]